MCQQGGPVDVGRWYQSRKWSVARLWIARWSVSVPVSGTRRVSIVNIVVSSWRTVRMIAPIFPCWRHSSKRVVCALRCRRSVCRCRP